VCDWWLFVLVNKWNIDKDYDIKVVRDFNYLGTVINNINDETEEIKARILAANKSFTTKQTIFKSKQIHQNNKVRLFVTLSQPILCYESITWTLTQMREKMLCTFERKILKRIYGPIQDKWCLHPSWNRKFIIFTKI